MAPKKHKKVKLTDDKKKELAREVQKFRPLWDIADAGYMKREVIAASWGIVSENTDLTVETCKEGWKSLKDALNYRKKAKPGKSGAGADDDIDNDDNCGTESQAALEAWTFWDALKFLAESKPGRVTISSLEIQDETEDSGTQENFDDSLSQDKPQVADKTDDTDIRTPVTREEKAKTTKRTASNYDYLAKRCKETPDNTDKDIAKGIQELVQLRKEASQTKPKSLIYESMYANYDRMLAKLPSPVVEDLNQQIGALIYAEVKKYDQLIELEIRE